MGGLADLTHPLFSTMENMANGNGFSTGRGGGQGSGVSQRLHRPWTTHANKVEPSGKEK